MSIELIVKNDLCTGCGVCISEDMSKQAKMIWNNNGFLVPELGVDSTQEKMIKVCPFFKDQKNEDELGDSFLKSDFVKKNPKLGYFSNLYIGFSNEFRETSSSGGIATYVFKELLEKKIVDYLFIVKEKNGEYCYQFFSDYKDITAISKTRYIPVTMSQLFEQISNIPGKVAISGVACFVKAIRLKQLYNPELKEKIPFIVGIICGGLKSKHYTDFLAQSAGCFAEYDSAQYRVKNKNSYALDYKFSCSEKDNNRIHMVEMKKLGDMWGTGLFKSNACDFCDDVVTELADISLGDAWLDPYHNDGLGNSVIIVRSRLANNIISNGIKNKIIYAKEVTEDMVIESQKGSYNHRHRGLLLRLKLAAKNGKISPLKRKRFLEKQNILFNIIQIARMNTRKNSIKYWRDEMNISKFNALMKPSLDRLKFLTRCNLQFTRFKSILKKMVIFK